MCSRRSHPIERIWSPSIGTLARPYEEWRQGDHVREGMVLARGPGIEPGKRRGVFHTADLGATFSAALGVRLEGVDGRPIASIVPRHADPVEAARRRSSSAHVTRVLGRRARRRVPEWAKREDAGLPRLRDELAAKGAKFHGLLHSIAFADYTDGMKPFHETPKRAFLRGMDISCYSLMAVSNALKDLLEPDASVVTVSISTTRMASENYGYMAPIKAALDSSLAFLTKSFSRFSKIRFNAVAPGLLKTSASAGIPGYIDSYLYAEQIIPRKEAVQTQEAADVAVFLLSPKSSGIVAQNIVVDAGMSINYFDAEIVARAMKE